MSLVISATTYGGSGKTVALNSLLLQRPITWCRYVPACSPCHIAYLPAGDRVVIGKLDQSDRESTNALDPVIIPRPQ
jgi:hypothetical protein